MNCVAENLTDCSLGDSRGNIFEFLDRICDIPGVRAFTENGLCRHEPIEENITNVDTSSDSSVILLEDLSEESA